MKSWTLYFLLLLLAQFGCSHSSKKNFSSIVYTEYGQNAYSDSSNQSYIKILSTTKLQTLSLLFTCHTKDKLSSDVDCSSENSPQIERLIHLIKTQKEKNYQITLRVYIDLLSGDWRALWNPKDKKLAFKNMETELLKILLQFPEQSVDLFVLGAEYEKLTLPQYHNDWKRLIQNIRNSYSGLLTYGANTNLSDREIPELHWVPFWNELDYIGIDYYFPVAQKSDNIPIHYENLKNLLSPFKDKNQKIFINEIGIPLASKGYLKPYEWKWLNETADPLSQASYLSDFFQAARLHSIKDIQVWRFMPNESLTFPFGYIIDDALTLRSIKSLSF